MQLHYQTIGAGQPLILIHGLFGSADNWMSIAKQLAENYQVISLDLRNHGRSPHSDSQTYSEMSDDLLALCDNLGLNSIHLLGHSLGGKVAMQFAQQYPERLDKLIIVDMALREYEDEHTHLIDAMLALDLSQINSRLEADKALTASIPNKMVRQFLLMNLDKTANGWQWRLNLPALKANYAQLRGKVGTDLQYDKPSLFIRGERSHYVQDADIEKIKQHFTSASFVSLPTDHWVHAEQPQAFIVVVRDFLSTP